MQKTIFTFFGPPGSGKGTLAEKCVKELGFEMLSTGNLCRKHVSLGTEIGKLIGGLLKEGKLIPDDIITNMVADWLQEKVALGKPVILDGYPRTIVQAELFLKMFKDLAPDYKFRVICFQACDEELIKRLTNRFVCENKDCQAVYPPLSAAVKKGICDLCGSKLIKREDDNAQVVKARLKHYPKYRDELLGFYKSADILIEKLSVENKTIERVFEDFKTII